MKFKCRLELMPEGHNIYFIPAYRDRISNDQLSNSSQTYIACNEYICSLDPLA